MYKVEVGSQIHQHLVLSLFDGAFYIDGKWGMFSNYHVQYYTGILTKFGYVLNKLACMAMKLNKGTLVNGSSTLK